MQERDEDGLQERASRFQVTIFLPAGASLPEDLDLDVLPQPPGAQTGILAVAGLDDVKRLVVRGARVSVERVISDTFPPELVMSDEEARARLERLADLRERDAD